MDDDSTNFFLSQWVDNTVFVSVVALGFTIGLLGILLAYHYCRKKASAIDRESVAKKMFNYDIASASDHDDAIDDDDDRIEMI
jgi:hypothetical protein